MIRQRATYKSLWFLCLLAVPFFTAACGKEKPEVRADSAALESIAGDWTLAARVTGNGETPAQDRFVKLSLKRDGTFRFLFQGDKTQPWITAGEGAFSFTPPTLSFYWDNGAQVRLLVVEKSENRMRLHHGRNLVPVKGADPDEVYVRAPSHE
jgi:outer membrane lipoprotein-sorting protein